MNYSRNGAAAVAARICLAMAAAASLLSGCERPPRPGSGKWQIAAIIFQEDQFFRMVELGMQEAAARLDVELHLGNSQGALDKEISLVDTYAARGVDAIVISPLSGKASINALKRAYDKAVRIITYNASLDADFPASYIESNQFQLGASTGRAAREYIQEKLGGKAKIATIGFASQLPESGGARLAGFLEEVGKLPGAQIVAQQEAWLAPEAANVVSSILTAHPDLDLVWAANEGGTVGAVTAVNSCGRAGRVAVFGTDMSRQLADFLLADDNVLQAVTDQKPFEIGRLAVQAAVDALEGKPVDKKTSLPGTLLVRSRPEEVKSCRERLEALSK